MATMIEAEELCKTFRVVRRRPGLPGGLRSVIDPEVRMVEAVQSLSLHVERGEMISLIGPNGAGKSTTIKMLTGILVPTGGHVRVAGLIPMKQRRELAARIGVVFGQRSQLWWDLPLLDSLRLLRHLYRVPEERHNANLARLRALLDLDEFLTTPVRQLSLGQRMRGDLAAALLCVARDPLALISHIWYAYSRDNSKIDVLADNVPRSLRKAIAMDSSLQSIHTTTDEINASLAADHAGAEAEEEHHVHLPNPSLWPLILSAAILLAVAGLLFIPANFWLTLLAIPIVLIGIMGWALEDPMAPVRESFVTISQPAIPSRFHIGQDVFDKDGEWLGTVRARFPNYILVEHGGLFPKPYYVPQRFAKSNIERNIVALSLSENELKSSGYGAIPDDLYDEAADFGLPPLNGTPLFARGPLSPAETGHYNYGPNYPGINTDASGSYHREEVVPRPQRYVAPRRRLYATDPAVASSVPEIPAGIEESGQVYVTDRTIPPRTISPD